MRVRPQPELGPLLQDLGAAREERPHRESQHLVQHVAIGGRRNRRGIGRCRGRELPLRSASIPAAHDIDQIPVAARGLRLDVVVLFERAEATQYVGGLTHHQTEIRQIERDVFEAEDGSRIALMSREDGGRQLQRRQRHAHLNASLKFEQFEMKINGAGQLGMPFADGV